MNDIQERIEALQANGWTLAAIGDEVGTHRESVSRWKSGMYYPENSKAVLMALDTLLDKPAPKKRRYPQGHYLQQRKAQSESKD